MDIADYAEYLLKNHRIIKKEIEIMEIELRRISQEQNEEVNLAARSFIKPVVQKCVCDMSKQDMEKTIVTARDELDKLEKAMDLLEDGVKGVIIDLYVYRLNWAQVSCKRYISMNTLNRRRKKGIGIIAGALSGSSLRNFSVNIAKGAGK